MRFRRPDVRVRTSPRPGCRRPPKWRWRRCHARHNRVRAPPDPARARSAPRPRRRRWLAYVEHGVDAGQGGGQNRHRWTIPACRCRNGPARATHSERLVAPIRSCRASREETILSSPGMSESQHCYSRAIAHACRSAPPAKSWQGETRRSANRGASALHCSLASFVFFRSGVWVGSCSAAIRPDSRNVSNQTTCGTESSEMCSAGGHTDAAKNKPNLATFSAHAVDAGWLAVAGDTCLVLLMIA